MSGEADAVGAAYLNRAGELCAAVVFSPENVLQTGKIAIDAREWDAALVTKADAPDLPTVICYRSPRVDRAQIKVNSAIRYWLVAYRLDNAMLLIDERLISKEEALPLMRSFLNL